MKKTLAITGIALAMSLGAPAGIAGDFDKQIKARQAYMQIFSFNLGQLGAMAKGDAPYDAKAANAAAQNLLLAARMDNSAMWPKGSDVEVPGHKGETRAKPEIWTTWPKVSEKHQDLTRALETMASVAGNGLGAMKGAMGGVGDGCKGCHESFRAPKE